MVEKTKIMVVEDERITAMEIVDRLEDFGYSVPATATSGEDAVKKAEEFTPDLILMDIMLEGNMDGIQAAEQIRKHLDIPVVYLTAYADEGTFGRAKITQPFGYILKPFDERELKLNIEIGLYRHKMECLVKEKEQWLTETLGSMWEGLIATDEAGNVKLINPYAEIITGLDQQDVLGKPLETVFRVINEDTGEVVIDSIINQMQEDVFYDLTNKYALTSTSDTNIPLEMVGAPIKDANNKIVGNVIVFDDITDRRQMEAELIRTKTEAETSNRIKSEFLVNFTDEIRTQLNTIVGYSDVVLNENTGTLNEVQEDRIVNISEKGKYLLELVNNVFDMAKVEAGTMELHYEEFSVFSAIHDVKDRLYSLASSKGVTLDLDVGHEIGTINADRAKFNQILYNLMDNAIKYNNEGGLVTITAKSEGGLLRICVTDTGVGIAKDELKKVFQPFAQLSHGTVQQYEGFGGLDLALVNEYVQLHGGNIRVESELGSGSRFSFEIPVERIDDLNDQIWDI